MKQTLVKVYSIPWHCMVAKARKGGHWTTYWSSQLILNELLYSPTDFGRSLGKPFSFKDFWLFLAPPDFQSLLRNCKLAEFGSFKNDVQLNILEWNEVNEKGLRFPICKGFIVQHWLAVWKSEIFTHLDKKNAQKRWFKLHPQK